MHSGRRAPHDRHITEDVVSPNRSLDHGPDADTKRRWFGRLWRDHEEGVLYALAAVIYIPAGVFLKTVVLNWMLGILFPLIVVYVVPKQIRRSRSKTPGADPEVGS